MGRRLADGADGAIVLVDQDQLFFRHSAQVPWQKSLGTSPFGRPGEDDRCDRRHHRLLRRSFTRTALPCERGTSPGSFSTTSQVTPTIVLM